MFQLAQQTLMILLLFGAACLGAGHGVEESNHEVSETEIELIVSHGGESLFEKKHFKRSPVKKACDSDRTARIGHCNESGVRLREERVSINGTGSFLLP